MVFILLLSRQRAASKLINHNASPKFVLVTLTEN